MYLLLFCYKPIHNSLLVAFCMFDVTRSRKIGRKEFCKAIGCPYFGPDDEKVAERKKRISSTVNQVFSKFDKDGDGYLNWEEFSTWAESAPEMEKLQKLFSNIDSKLTSSGMFTNL